MAGVIWLAYAFKNRPSKALKNVTRSVNGAGGSDRSEGWTASTFMSGQSHERV